MSTKALIFDCDGTLMDSLAHALESFHYALERLGHKRSTPDIIRYFGMSADRILHEVLGDAVLARDAYALYKQRQEEWAPQTLVYPGIRELLARARAASVPLGLVTGRHREDLEILLKPHGLLEYFSAIVTDNELTAPKPSPEGLNKALAELGARAQESFYIGDSVSDMKAAHNAGMRAVAALWDPKTERQLLSGADPDILAADPHDVWLGFLAGEAGI